MISWHDAQGAIDHAIFPLFQTILSRRHRQRNVTLYARPKLTLLLIVTLLFATAAVAEQGKRTIALTFDDAPRPDTAYLTGPDRATKLIAALKAAGVPKVMFFSNTDRFGSEGADRMKRYAAAGHSIGNHSHTHADLHRIGAQPFVEDIRRADEILRTLPGFTKWFRYPYLHEGKTIEDRDAIRVALKEMGYRSGYVTVDNYDWHMDTLFQQAVSARKTINFDHLRDAYADLITQSVEFYDGVARETLGRSPKHVLLLHENDLAALYIADLVSRLRSKGWTIISAEEAFTDPIAAVEPDTLLLGQGRVIAMAVAKGYKGPTRMWEDEEKLKAEFERRGAWK